MKKSTSIIFGVVGDAVVPAVGDPPALGGRGRSRFARWHHDWR